MNVIDSIVAAVTGKKKNPQLAIGSVIMKNAVAPVILDEEKSALRELDTKWREQHRLTNHVFTEDTAIKAFCAAQDADVAGVAAGKVPLNTKSREDFVREFSVLNEAHTLAMRKIEDEAVVICKKIYPRFITAGEAYVAKRTAGERAEAEELAVDFVPSTILHAAQVVVASAKHRNTLSTMPCSPVQMLSFIEL